MDREEYLGFIRNIHDKKMAITATKSGDYATEDVLSNFKRVSALCKILNVDAGRPSDCALYMLLHKLDRVQNLRNKGCSPRNESLADSLIDASIYLDLIMALVAEEGKK